MSDDLTAPRPHGNHRQHVLNRLRRENLHEWVEAIESGRISAYAVACEMGWTMRPATASGEMGNEAKRRRYSLAAEHKRVAQKPTLPAPDKLTGRQREFLLYGPRCEAFDTEEEVIAAWEKHREELMASCLPGRRPWGFRAIDRPDIPWRGYDRERSINWRAGVLTPEERNELETQWRRDFERAQGLPLLESSADRESHYRWADIPRELVRLWSAQRRVAKSQKEKPRSSKAGLESA